MHIKVISFAILSSILFSCGNNIESDKIIGDWTVNTRSVEVEYSSDAPGELKNYVSRKKDELISVVKRDQLHFEFKNDGELLVHARGNVYAMKWKIDDNDLKISGKFRWLEGSLNLEIQELNSEKLTVTLKSDEIARLHNDYPDKFRNIPIKYFQEVSISLN